jgi:hypothetical protein
MRSNTAPDAAGGRLRTKDTTPGGGPPPSNKPLQMTPPVRELSLPGEEQAFLQRVVWSVAVSSRTCGLLGAASSSVRTSAVIELGTGCVIPISNGRSRVGITGRTARRCWRRRTRLEDNPWSECAGCVVSRRIRRSRRTAGGTAWRRKSGVVFVTARAIGGRGYSRDGRRSTRRQ